MERSGSFIIISTLHPSIHVFFLLFSSFFCSSSVFFSFPFFFFSFPVKQHKPINLCSSIKGFLPDPTLIEGQLCFSLITIKMEGKKHVGLGSSSSSLTTDLFGSKETSYSSTTGIFGSIFAPSSKVYFILPIPSRLLSHDH